MRPKKNSNGTCAAYTVVPDDNCSKLGAANGLTIIELEKFNNGTTWGWSGCSNIMVGTKICLSDGSPPMPAPVANAMCGPTKPGTLSPTWPQKLSDLNPCPLNICCNVWGQCGIKVRGPSNNPGTSPPGTNGCVANCGLNITNNDKGPEYPMSIGYYEAWNFDRPCLHMEAKELDIKSYTHLHWAFGTVNPDLTVTVNDTNKQFTDFTSLLNVKKIISFGGWGFSTEPATYDLLRQAMKPANANKFAIKIVSFCIEHILDGVDFDWEYPGAPDIPGIPPGKDDDTTNYLAFLKQLRYLLPTHMTISIAAPASYWYLKAFPIAEMAKVADYIVYMTYDLHGQWDYNSTWANPGCPMGNCLRSHVNLTETMYSLSMITKAGVPSNKIAVGVSSYGRSFKMTNPACTGPECTFIGPETKAEPGQCTQTPGILADAEIAHQFFNLLNEVKTPARQTLTEDDFLYNRIKNIFPNTTTRYDDVSGSDILIYGTTEWVAYLSDNSKRFRKDTYKRLNFAGSVDWALDLQAPVELDLMGLETYVSEDNSTYIEQLSGNAQPLPVCSSSYTTFEQLEKDADTMPDNCRALYALQALDSLLTEALANYTDIMAKGYDDKFNAYAGAVVNSASKNVVDFYTGNGNKYFTCVVVEMEQCCSDCHKYNPKPNDPHCRYCHNDSCKKKREDVFSIGLGLEESEIVETSLVTREGVTIATPAGRPKSNYKMVNHTEPCPPDYSLRSSSGPDYKDTVYWSLREDKVSVFWADLLEATGITPENIAFKNIQNYPCDGFPKEECIYHGQWAMNVPAPQGYDKSDISNPKDLISKALENSKKLGPQIKDLLFTIRVDFYMGDPFDAVDALGIPITMIADAVANMVTVADIGKGIEDAEAKAKREKIIFGFLTTITIFVPVAGEVMSAVAGLATIGRIVSLLGVAGNAAFDSYTIVKDPKNAPLAIFGLILAPLGLTDAIALAKAARIARNMDSKDAIKLGTSIGKRLAVLQRVTKICKR
ncbi:hypothetical protein HYFRA_00009106 [Hymenoscyphus fraxineus]|uniref:chitinase n=1 Tax=Hymenoscyphus fraxineus TaxID=746836 RepID=A0A9N9PTZ3_9HELO|nr:hypothetical protein HYFRA_00009106 [Hymenoscyphus fraxineus]